MMKKLKMLIASKRDEHWEGHSQAVQDLLPIFCESDSINYPQYGPWYMKKMQKLPSEHLEMYQEFLERKFLVKTNQGYSNSVSREKLEQTKQRSSKSASGIIDQTRKENFVTKWKSVYQETLAISNRVNDLTRTNQGFQDGELIHHELPGSFASEIQYAMRKVSQFILWRGNQYATDEVVKLNNFVSGKVVQKRLQNASSLLLRMEKNDTRTSIRRVLLKKDWNLLLLLRRWTYRNLKPYHNNQN